VVKPAVEENDYQGVHDAMRAKGMSPAWINAYTIDKGPFYFYTFFTVVFRPGLGADQPTFHGLDAAGDDAHPSSPELLIENPHLVASSTLAGGRP
jgi:hypothetical protein